MVRLVHTVVYVVMAIGTLFILYAGIVDYFRFWLYAVLGLLAIEVAVFVGNGMKCALTALAKRYGAEKGYAFDTFLPEKFTRHTFRVSARSSRSASSWSSSGPPPERVIRCPLPAQRLRFSGLPFLRALVQRRILLHTSCIWTGFSRSASTKKLRSSSMPSPTNSTSPRRESLRRLCGDMRSAVAMSLLSMS